MEQELSKKIQEIKEAQKCTGILLVDNLGLPIESQGNLDKTQSGVISSLMKNAAKLETILSQREGEEESQRNPDLMAKIYFKNEHLVVRNKNGMTLALRQEGGI